MRRLNILTAALFLATPAIGQDMVDGFAARVYRSASGQKTPYRLFVPRAYDSTQQYPLVLWLHGAGGRGRDNRKQIEGDQVAGTRIWTGTDSQIAHPSFVLVPQSPGCWDTTGWSANCGQTALTDSNTLSNQLQQVVAILDSLEREFNIDSKRLYIAGQSFGGYGTWNFITKRPEIFAAAIILCGGGDPKLAARASAIPIWSFQGDQDALQIVVSNRAMIDAVTQSGGHPRYTEYPGMNHKIWDRVFSEPELVNWLFSQHK